MTGFVIMIVCCTVLAAISQKRNRTIRKHHKDSREHLFFIALVCYMSIFAGLRVYYNDTSAYIDRFNASLTFPEILSDLEWSLSEHPGFFIYTAIVKTINDSPNFYLMVSSAVILSCHLWMLRKYSKDLPLTVFLFFTLGYYAFTMAAVKQTLAIAIALIAIDRLLQKKRVSFVLLILLACTFHPYSLMFLITPLLMKQVPWAKGTWLLILGVAAAAYSFNFFQGILLDVTDLFGEGYNEDTFVGEGVSIFRVLVYMTPVVISFIWRKKLFKHTEPIDNLIITGMLASAMIVFIGLFGNANMFYRMSTYFEPFVYLAIPWMFQKLKTEMSGYVLTFGSYVAFFAYFVIQMKIVADFDKAFGSITMGRFIESLIE